MNKTSLNSTTVETAPVTSFTGSVVIRSISNSLLPLPPGCQEEQPVQYTFLCPPQSATAMLTFSVVSGSSSPSYIWAAPLCRIHSSPLTPETLLLTSKTFSLAAPHPSTPLERDPFHINPTAPAESTNNSPQASNPPTKIDPSPLILRFSSPHHLTAFVIAARRTYDAAKESVSHLDASDSATVQSYFQYYGKMSNQMNMLQDGVRTKTYRNAILYNSSSFLGKRVMDVGAGSGILSFFSAQAGASVVYVVEASSAATLASTLAAANPDLGACMKVINSTVERISVEQDLDNEKVDILVSEPIGTFIFNERMIESFLYARDMFLKPGGSLYPNRCCLFLAPFSDANLYNDYANRSSFWAERNFYGIDLSSVYDRAVDELFRQPVVDYIDPSALMTSEWHRETFDLKTIPRDSLTNIEIKYRFPISTPCVIHGLAGWFDVLFDAGEHPVGFSTSPLSPPTHWYQIRFLFRLPLAVNPRQVVTGTLHMTATAQQSYYVTASAMIEGTDIYTSSTVIDLKDPDYRYYTNPHTPYIPPTRTPASMQLQEQDPLQPKDAPREEDNPPDLTNVPDVESVAYIPNVLNPAEASSCLGILP